MRLNKLHDRFPMRNRFIPDYIFQITGKQVGSRLQQMRDTYKGGPSMSNSLVIGSVSPGVNLPSILVGRSQDHDRIIWNRVRGQSSCLSNALREYLFQRSTHRCLCRNLRSTVNISRSNNSFHFERHRKPPHHLLSAFGCSNLSRT